LWVDCFLLIHKLHRKNISATQIMQSIEGPLASVRGEYPNNVVTTTQISQTYLNLTIILKLPQLKTNMTLTKLCSCVLN